MLTLMEHDRAIIASSGGSEGSLMADGYCVYHLCQRVVRGTRDKSAGILPWNVQ